MVEVGKNVFISEKGEEPLINQLLDQKKFWLVCEKCKSPIHPLNLRQHQIDCKVATEFKPNTRSLTFISGNYCKHMTALSKASLLVLRTEPTELKITDRERKQGELIKSYWEYLIKHQKYSSSDQKTQKQRAFVSTYFDEIFPIEILCDESEYVPRDTWLDTVIPLHAQEKTHLPPLIEYPKE